MFRVTLFSLALTAVPNTVSNLVKLTFLYLKRFLFLETVSIKVILAIIFLSANAAYYYAGNLSI
jgi:hypothetical protein